MNYGQLSRAVNQVYEMSNGELKDDTPAYIFVDNEYRQVIAIYPENNGKLVIILEAGTLVPKEDDA